MLTEIAKGIKGVADGVAGLTGVKAEQDAPAATAPAVSREPAEGSVTESVATEVQSILEAARGSASRIVADAREEAARIVADARREAAVIKDEAGREAEPVPPAGAQEVAVEPIEPAVAEPAQDAPAEPVEAPLSATTAPEQPVPPEEPAEPDEAAIRLVAMNLAMGDASRAEIKDRVEQQFGTVTGLEAILDDVLTRIS